jgi:hypothetical protein
MSSFYTSFVKKGEGLLHACIFYRVSQKSTAVAIIEIAEAQVLIRPFQLKKETFIYVKCTFISHSKAS